MPKMGQGKQVKVFLSNHLLAALEQDAKDSGEKRIQPIMRYILGQHYQKQAQEARLEIASVGQGTG